MRTKAIVFSHVARTEKVGARQPNTPTDWPKVSLLINESFCKNLGLYLQRFLFLEFFLELSLFLEQILRIRIFLFNKTLILRVILIFKIFQRMAFILRIVLRIRNCYTQNSYS